MWWAALLNSLVSIFSGGGASGGGASYESIATATAAGGETSVSFSSIPSTFKNLEIRWKGIGSTSTLYWQFNSDTGSNYAWHRIYGSSGTAGATGTASTTQIGGSLLPSTATGDSGCGIFSIVDYASTSKYKTLRGLTGSTANSYIALVSGLWMSTSALSSIQLNFAGDPLAAGSTFALYGIKG
jgi:hypothetical protein